MANEKKKELGRPSTSDFYQQCLQMAPRISELLSAAELISDIKSASDWSYTASTYHLTNARICGDAGSFIDPLFSSGVHLAITGGLSAATTIAAQSKETAARRQQARGTLRRQWKATLDSSWPSAVLRSRFVNSTSLLFRTWTRMDFKGRLIFSDPVRAPFLASPVFRN